MIYIGFEGHFSNKKTNLKI